MPVWLDHQSPDFEAAFKALLLTKREVSEEVDQAARAIIKAVVVEGDAALLRYSLAFDRVDLAHLGLRVTPAEIADAVAASPPEALAALRLAHSRIVSFHERQRPEDLRFTDPLGVDLGWRWTPIQAVGLYVPGGTASYPSSVLMNAVPAKVAGVERVVMVVPAPDGVINPLVLAAADLAGVDEVYRVGGAQAVAALAYGTATIAPVAKIVGPGNAYVAAAKRQVFGTVGIDMIAGPSEVLIIADDSGDPEWIAADLLAQAEHDTAAQSILVTDSPGLARAVEVAVETQLRTLSRQAIAGASWRDFGAIILVPDLAAAVPLADRLAPEHLEIIARDAEALSAAIRNAGAIFLGAYTPEAVGDYVGGSNHVLPTARSARFSSGLNVLDFLKKTSILKCSPESLAAIGPAAVTLGIAEGLDGHARSVALRLKPGTA
jgi:histidinol dehydrogenase